MLRVLLACVRPFLDGLQSHGAHPTTQTLAARMEPVSRQVGRNLTAPEEWVLRGHTVDFSHQFQRLRIHANRHVIKR